MTHRAATLIALFVFLAAMPAQAACYADYKAKQDDPLRLHYGVIELPDVACGDAGRVSAEISRRIGAAGWQLLNVVSTFDADGLEQRKSSAAEFFLRF